MIDGLLMEAVQRGGPIRGQCIEKGTDHFSLTFLTARSRFRAKSARLIGSRLTEPWVPPESPSTDESFQG